MRRTASGGERRYAVRWSVGVARDGRAHRGTPRSSGRWPRPATASGRRATSQRRVPPATALLPVPSSSVGLSPRRQAVHCTFSATSDSPINVTLWLISTLRVASRDAITEVGRTLRCARHTLRADRRRTVTSEEARTWARAQSTIRPVGTWVPFGGSRVFSTSRTPSDAPGSVAGPPRKAGGRHRPRGPGRRRGGPHGGAAVIMRLRFRPRGSL
jgi:hypothetical protein